jgi:hypothetical protein
MPEAAKRLTESGGRPEVYTIWFLKQAADFGACSTALTSSTRTMTAIKATPTAATTNSYGAQARLSQHPATATLTCATPPRRPQPLRAGRKPLCMKPEPNWIPTTKP